MKNPPSTDHPASKTQVAEAILEQLGGHGFVRMTGARELTAGQYWLSFRLPGNMCLHGINHVKITLTPADVYEVVFSAIRGTNIKTVSKHDQIYCDMLAPLFRDKTGMETRMPRICFRPKPTL